MAFFGLFGKKEEENPIEKNNEISYKSHVLFGRYTDCNKTNKQLDNWDLAVSKNKEEKYTESLIALFEYIKDDEINNFSYKKESDNSVSFEFIQGSKVIKGYSDGKTITAEARIALFEKNSVPIMRKLTTLNYSLKYSWFAINQNYYCIRFTGLHVDNSPTKLYWTPILNVVLNYI